IIEPEPYLPAPLRKKGSVRLHDSQSLVAYTTDHMTAATHIYADVDEATFVSVLDDHGSVDGPGWAQHRATLVLHRTPEWQHWLSHDGQYLAQTAFAEHVEDGLSEIVSPPAADLLEIAQSFRATTNVEFKTDKRLASGQHQLTYVETIDAKAGARGDLSVPESLVLSIAPYEGMEPAEVKARVRFRLKDGHLSIGYKIDHPDRVERAAFAVVAGHIQSATGITPLMGTPRA
ncbi:MAG: DUF2303 family protein, partial [bacterium]